MNPETITIFCKTLHQAQHVDQFTYVDEGDNIRRRRKGLPYYTLYVDESVQHAPGAILVECTVTNDLQKEALEGAIERGQIYLNKTDWEMTMNGVTK